MPRDPPAHSAPPPRFIGSIVRNRRMVKAYSFLTIIAFLLGSAAAGFLLYLVYSNKPFCLTVEGKKECVANNIKIGEKIGLTAAVVVEWLGQLCECPVSRPRTPPIFRCIPRACPAARLRPMQTLGRLSLSARVSGRARRILTDETAGR